MNSSRMRPVRCSGHLWGGGGVCLGGCLPRGCLSGGVWLGGGGCLPAGVCLPRECVPAQGGVGLPRGVWVCPGGVCPGGCLPRGLSA